MMWIEVNLSGTPDMQVRLMAARKDIVQKLVQVRQLLQQRALSRCTSCVTCINREVDTHNLVTYWLCSLCEQCP